MRIKCVVHNLLLILMCVPFSLLWSLKTLCFHYRGAVRDELALLQKIQHPNVVQFLGVMTQSSPMMIVIEYLPKV